MIKLQAVQHIDCGLEVWWVHVNGAKVLGPFASERLAESKINAFTTKYLKGK